jgi:hypothetical protein
MQDGFGQVFNGLTFTLSPGLLPAEQNVPFLKAGLNSPDPRFAVLLCHCCCGRACRDHSIMTDMGPVKPPPGTIYTDSELDQPEVRSVELAIQRIGIYGWRK